MATRQGKPFLPTLNGIRSAQHVRGQDVAEAFDQIVERLGDLQVQVAGIKPTTSTTTVQQTTVPHTTAKPQTQTPNENSFDAITTGTNNQADMIVSDGAVLTYDPTPGSTGVVDSNEIGGVNVAGNTPTHPGQLLISQPGNTAAIWADPQVQGLYAEGDSITSPPVYTAPTTIQPVYGGVRAGDTLVGLRTTDTFNTFQGQGGTPSSDPVWTPAAGLAFRLMKFQITISGNSNTASGGLLTMYFTDGPAGPQIGLTYDVWIQPETDGNVTGYFTGTLFDTGLVDMGNGFLSGGTDRTLYLHCSLQLNNGFIRVNLMGTEE